MRAQEFIVEAGHQHTEIIKHNVGDWVVYIDDHSVIRSATRNIGPRMHSSLIASLATIPDLENKVPVGGSFWIQDNKTKSSFYFRRLDIPGEPLALRCETGVKDDPRTRATTPVFRVNAYTGPESPNDLKIMANLRHRARYTGVNSTAADFSRTMQQIPRGSIDNDYSKIISNPSTQDSHRYDRAFTQAKKLKKDEINEGTDFTNAVNSIEKLITQNNIEFTSYEDLLKFVASRKFLQAQRNDQQFVNDVARAVLRRIHQTQLNEINDEDELSVSQRIQDYFTDRGYGYLGEGRDQIAFLSPRGTVVKVVGIGEDEREDIVKTYVGFFLRNQRNPHYPRIYNAGDFAVDGETYFVYEMEYLNPVSGEDRVLEYIEDLMSALPRGEQALAAFYKNKTRPPELSEQQVDGLVMATQDLEDAIGGQAPLDLRSIENLGRRKDGQIVIIDPFSL